MQVVVAALVCGIAGGLLAGATAARFPGVVAPRVSPRVVLDEAERHPSVARVLWSRVSAAHVGELALGAVLVAAIIGGVLVGIVLWMVRQNAGLAEFDLGAARWGARHATNASTDVLRAISQLGGTIGSIVIAVLVVVAVGRHLRRRDVVTFLAVVMVGESILVAVVKASVDRARPDIDRLTGFSGASFPSGHAATAAATLAAAALLLGVGRSARGRVALAGVAGGVAVLVAATRVLLGVHWLTDVLAGLVLGWTWFAIVSVAYGGRLLRFAEPIEAAERVATRSTRAATRRPSPVGPEGDVGGGADVVVDQQPRREAVGPAVDRNRHRLARADRLPVLELDPLDPRSLGSGEQLVEWRARGRVVQVPVDVEVALAGRPRAHVDPRRRSGVPQPRAHAATRVRQREPFVESHRQGPGAPGRGIDAHPHGPTGHSPALAVGQAGDPVRERGPDSVHPVATSTCASNDGSRSTSSSSRRSTHPPTPVSPTCSR